MGKIRFSFALMLLTALLVMAGGMRLARRTVIDRKEVDQNRLTDFSAKLSGQLEHQDKALLVSRRNLAVEIQELRNEEVKNLLRNHSSARAAYLYRNGRPFREWILLLDKPLPEVFLTGRKSPLNPDRSIALPEKFFEDLTYGEEGIIRSTDGNYELFWFSPIQGEVVAVVYETSATIEQYLVDLKQEARLLLTTLTQNRLSTVIVDERGQNLHHPEALPRPEQANLVIPHESAAGVIWLKDWDQISERTTTHAPTFWASVALSLALVGAGLFLYFSQVRSFRESQERVSFVNRVTHELGTPLTNMTLNLELASRSLRSQPEAAGRRLEKVSEEVGRLSRMVVNVLRHSNENPHSAAAEVSCDPNIVIASVISQFRPALERRKIKNEWRPGEMPSLPIDPDALSQITWNLISNVEKYASAGRYLGVSTGFNDGLFTMKVRDHGGGIPLTKRKEIFKAFERVHETASEGVSGTGLGLSISRDLAKVMGGKLTLLDSEEGALFQFTVSTSSNCQEATT